MARTLQQTIFLIILILVLLLSTFILIMTVQANITFWMIRPSESAALDIVGYTTALGGTTGVVNTEYKGFTSDITYYVLNREKMVCIIAEKTPEQPLAGGGPLKTINCYSTPFIMESIGVLDPFPGEPLALSFEKLKGTSVTVKKS